MQPDPTNKTTSNVNEPERQSCAVASFQVLLNVALQCYISPVKAVLHLFHVAALVHVKMEVQSRSVSEQSLR